MKRYLLLWAFVLGMFSMAFSQSKDNVARECVLFEVFTGVRCPYCPAAANGIAQMMDEGLAIAPVAYHTTAFSTDLYYTNETNARATYYGINSYPTLKADGITGMSGGGGAGENMYSYYRNYYNQRINVTSPFTIDLSYEPVDGTSCRVNCTVNQVGECNGSDVRVFIALTQCNIDVSWQGMQGLHHVCRDMIPSQTGTAFTGPTMAISETFEMPWPKEDCYLTAWVQNYSGSTKEVYQAVRMSMALDLDYDIVLKSVKDVVTQNCSGIQKPTLTIKNFGNETITFFDMCAYDMHEDHRQSWHGTLPKGQSVTVSMDEFVAAPCDALHFYVVMPNGEGDQFMTDNFIHVAMEDVPVIDGYLKMQLKTGAHPENTRVEIVEIESGEIVNSFTFDQASHVYTEEIVLMNAGCYRLRVRDLAGEGMGNGFFQFKDSNNHVVMKGGGAAGQFSFELSSEVQCDGTLSVNETEKDMPVVYPNPTQGMVYLNLGKGLWQVQVFDITGRKVMEHRCEGRSNIDLSKQQKGLYLLKAQNGTEEYHVKIVVR
jgi:hypothetical protein